MICEIRLCSPDSYSPYAAELHSLLHFYFFYFFTSRLSRFFFFCHILLGAIPLLLFLWAFRVNWQYEEGPDHTNITSKQQQIKQKRTYLLQS